MFLWSLTIRNPATDWPKRFLGVRAWRPLLLYCGAHSLLLYLFQFPVVHTSALAGLAQDVGLYQIDTWSSGAWPEHGQAAALLLLFVMVSRRPEI